MKKCILLLVCSFAFALSGLRAQNLQASFDYSTFMLPSESPYIETYLSFNGANFVLSKQENGKYKAAVQITLVVKKNDSIVYAEKYNLWGPEVEDSISKNFTFMDIQRISLPNGIYNLEITLADVAKPENTIKTNEKILINYSKDICASNIQLISSIKPTTKENILSKSGYDIEPYISEFIPEEMGTLIYYVEFYNIASILGAGKPFVVYSYLESYETGKKLENYQWQKKEFTKNTNIVLNSFNIDNLPSGNYNIKVELRDSNNNAFIYQKLFFQRSNPSVIIDMNYAVKNFSFAKNITNDSILAFYIQALEPISSEGEKNFILRAYKNASLEEKQDFFDGFWAMRNLENPEAEWLKYRELLSVVESKFSIPKKSGYKTDRGRTYLKYGPPDHIIDEKFRTSPGMRQGSKSAYLPYQIWRYDRIQTLDSRGMFVFWAPQSGKDYHLLHSNVIGEITDPFWENRLSRGGVEQGEIGEAGRQFLKGY